MYKLIRFYNQNRKTIFKIILIIVLAIGLLQLINYFIKMKNKEEIDSSNIISTKNNVNSELVSDKSLISGGSVSSTKLKRDTDIINKFVKYCNEGDVNSAYDLLTDECKEEMFSSVEEFNDIYYLRLFGNEKKMYTIENWAGNVYQVRFSGDILSTGNLNNNETNEDYITVVKQNNEDKLNINNYIGRKKDNKTTEYKNIKFTITSIDTYMDYEIYNLTIENNSEADILLDTNDDNKSVYLLDGRGMKYYFHNSEIIENLLLVRGKLTNELQIKFSNSYSSTRKIETLVFSKLVLNCEDYKENSQEYKFDQVGLRVNI